MLLKIKLKDNCAGQDVQHNCYSHLLHYGSELKLR